MAWQLSVFLLPLAFAAGLSVLLAAVVGRRPEPLARTFAVLMLGIGVWALAAALEFGSTTLQAQVLWNEMEYFGAVVVPAAWFLLAVQYAGYDAWVTRRTVGALAVEPVLTLVFVWTNRYHNLVWRDVSQATVSDVSILEQAVGPWYWLNLGYSYVLVVAGLALLVRVFLQSNPVYRRQSAVLVVAAAVPLGANVAFNFGIATLPVDLTVFTFAISGTLFAFALFYFDLLDLEPVARDVLVEEMGNPVVVTNAQGTVVDTNGEARRVLAPDLGHGEPAPPALAGDLDSTHGDVYTATVDGRTRTYRVQKTPLTDHRDEVVGSIVVMDDVTDLRSHEERLAVLNRVLRHNVRNELTVVLGHLEEIADHLPDDRSVETARKHAQRVVDLSEQTRDVVETLDREQGEVTRIDAGAVVEDVADQFREDYPAAEIACNAEEARALVAAGDLLAVAITNLVENAIEHNDADDPTVRIDCTAEGERVRISVADDGPGVPPTERSVLVEGNETPLHHGSGLGLWLVHWIVTTSGGELRFEENVPRGSVVDVWLRRATDEA
jgi:signal transduction histidine kinase